MQEILFHIEQILSLKIVSYQALTGGSISKAYLIKSANKSFFLKVNSGTNALLMFQNEKVALDTIKQSKTIEVPQVFLVDKINKNAFILMEYIESKSATDLDMISLGKNLASLHQYKGNTFGFKSDNFIGSLPQSNKSSDDWASFYWNERIKPQLQLAHTNKYIKESEFPDKAHALHLFQETFDDVTPSLIHGDLWGGNYLIRNDGTPYLIDPAVYFGHAMVDIAMTKLFGGFSTKFYEAYHQIIPRSPFYEEQIKLYQLYYLLVHLNLFGYSYRSDVIAILKQFLL